MAKFMIEQRFMTAADALECVQLLAEHVDVVANVEDVDAYGWRSVWTRTERDAKMANAFMKGFAAGKSRRF